MRGPAYPIYLSALFRVFGDGGLGAVGFADIVLHAVTAALLTLALAMHLRPVPAACGGLLYAFWPTSFYYAGKGSSETMLALWMVVSFVLLLRLVRAPGWPAALGLGVALGLACLTRGSAVVMLVVTTAWLGAGVVRSGRGAGIVMVVILAWAATMSPWWARNARVTGAFVPFHSLVWYNAYHDDRFDEAHRWLARVGRTSVDWGDVPAGDYPPEVTRHPPGFLYPSALDAREDLDQEKRYRALVLERFRSPDYLAGKIARNAVDFWSASASVGKSRVLLASSLAWLVLLALATWRAWPERRWRGPLLACHAVTWLTWAMYLPFLAIFRHSIPTAPFVAFVIALGASRWRAQARSS
jgi:4-amino-4-deoxy-L-arabinose transferase-like glycosyltransferase